MKILIFSDPHGRIPLILRLIYEFQKKHDVDLVLITGDLGIFPDINKLDRASRKFAMKDITELGFSLYFEPIIYGYIPYKEIGKEEKEFIQKVLSGIKCKIIFIGGNHEDYEYLKLCMDKKRCIVPVEKNHILWFLQDNCVYDFNGLKICGLSGIDKNKCNPKKHHPLSLIDNNKVYNFSYIVMNEKPHILITHEGLNHPNEKPDNSSCLLYALQNINPVYHFFGHYHCAINEINYTKEYIELQKTRTTGIHLNETNFDAQGNLKSNCMGLLNWQDENDNKFSFVNDEWMKSITKYTWYKL